MAYDSPHHKYDPSHSAYILHQTYLKRLAEQVGMVDLVQPYSDSPKRVNLEQVYVDSPTGLSLSVNVKDWQILDWWISEEQTRPIIAIELHVDPCHKPIDLGYETAPFEILIRQVEQRIQDYRANHPNKKPSDYINHWKDGWHRLIFDLKLKHITAACDRLVILGGAESCKSTFVKFLALCLAGAGIDGWQRGANLSALENWPHDALTPIYIELSRFINSGHFPTDLTQSVTTDHLWAYIQNEVLGDDLAAYADALRDDLEHGHALLILDGLDEITYQEDKLKQRQAQLIGLASSLNTHYANSRIIVTSRHYAYEGWALPGFKVVTIPQFEHTQRFELIHKLYRAMGVTAAQDKASELNRQLGYVFPQLPNSPLFFTLMASLYHQRDSHHELPRQRGTLYRESIELLPDGLQFAHASFQDYLAALHLVRLCDEVNSFTPVRKHIISNPQAWRMPCLFVGDVLTDSKRRDDLWNLLDDLLDDNVKYFTANVPYWWAVWLASTILEEQNLLAGKKAQPGQHAVCDKLRDWIVKLIQTPQALMPPERAACGRALGLIGDPRPGVGLDVNGLPEFDWVDIPAPSSGKFTVMGNHQANHPRREVELKHDFKIAKYPVTFQQFDAFYHSDDYYGQSRYWDGFQDDVELQEGSESFDGYDNHPCNGKSWYQVVAFCRWLTAQYRAAGLIGDKAEIRLPTEQEWEYAARGTDDRVYPYGNVFNAKKNNALETNIGRISAVGLFPDGASPFGVLDMTGNLWEWCLNDYNNPEIIDGYNNGQPKTMRGGSFFEPFNLVTIASRADSFPYGGAWTGFRLVLSAPIDSLTAD